MNLISIFPRNFSKFEEKVEKFAWRGWSPPCLCLFSSGFPLSSVTFHFHPQRCDRDRLISWLSIILYQIESNRIIHLLSSQFISVPVSLSFSYTHSLQTGYRSIASVCFSAPSPLTSCRPLSLLALPPSARNLRLYHSLSTFSSLPNLPLPNIAPNLSHASSIFTSIIGVFTLIESSPVVYLKFERSSSFFAQTFDILILMWGCAKCV